jgi:hypothetical protein
MTDSGSAYGAVLGRNISGARGRLRLSQGGVAARMRALGFAHWQQQTAGAVEKATRRVTAEELLGLSLALQTSMRVLTTPAPDDRSVMLPGGQEIDALWVQRSVEGYSDRPLRWDGDVPQVESAPQDDGLRLALRAGLTTWSKAGPDGARQVAGQLGVTVGDEEVPGRQ